MFHISEKCAEPAAADLFATAAVTAAGAVR